MFKLNTVIVTIAAALAISANAETFGLKADDVLCVSSTNAYSCRGSSNLPGQTLGNVPTFPRVIGFPNTTFPGSGNCGDCYELTLVVNGQTRIRTVTVVSNSEPGSVNLCTSEYRSLTGVTGPLPPDGTFRVDLVEVPRAACGL